MKSTKLKKLVEDVRIEKKKRLLLKAKILLDDIKKTAHEEFGV